MKYIHNIIIVRDRSIQQSIDEDICMYGAEGKRHRQGLIVLNWTYYLHVVALGQVG